MGPTSSNALFDESYNFQPGFDVYQEDSRLSDLFSSKGESELCWPTSMAQRIAEQKLWRQPAFPGLQLVADPYSDDYTAQIRRFAELCKTDRENGTLVVDAVACLRKYYEDSGYAHPWVYAIGTAAVDAPAGEDLSAYQRRVTIDDIRRFASRDYGAILQVDWYKYDSAQNLWVQDGGHYINVYGYDYYRDWGDRFAILKVVNPDVDYTQGDPHYRYDSLSMIKIERQADKPYPSYSDYFLDGYSFKGIAYRGFIRNLVLFLPEAPQAP